MLQSKLLIALGIIVLLLAVLYFLGRKSVHHEILIDARPEQVWTVLLNTDTYDDWNPVMKVLEGEV
ncbi:MAG: SRPBCC domain-containing protein, partial [Cyanothece sp. SIO1E1]|nr:SRPBCC domain-containing protein [Cyanothece sp. SIO1E1]